jgi:hypothetical protein
VNRGRIGTKSGFLGGFETAFDGEIEAFIDLKE